MLNSQGRRLFASGPRPRTLLLIAFATVTFWYLLFSGPAPDWNIVVPHRDDVSTAPANAPAAGAGENPAVEVPVKAPADNGDGNDKVQQDKTKGEKKPWDIDIEELRKWQPEGDGEGYGDMLAGYEQDGKHREPGEIARLQAEKDLRKKWRWAYHVSVDLPSSNLIYKNTLESLDFKDKRTDELSRRLRDDADVKVNFSKDTPVRFNPYPGYNTDEWKKANHAPYAACEGPTGEEIEDLLVFKGRPSRWPKSSFGNHDVLNLDPNLCWERETRLGQYGFVEQKKKVGNDFEVLNWDDVNWANLQRLCVEKNAKRYDLKKSGENMFLHVYPEVTTSATPAEKKEPAAKESDKKESDKKESAQSESDKTEADKKVPEKKEPEAAPADKTAETPKIKGRSPVAPRDREFVAENRTAVLLRSYTNKVYSENDKQVVRSLISELSLRTGGEYEVFLFVQVKDNELRIFEDDEVYQQVLNDNIPPEFHGITVLWNDQQVKDIYTELKDPRSRSVHTAQWLGVQKFSHDHPQFDYIWNWEMDFRFTGHHYDLLDNLSKFARKQPRRGLWERNERYYIPEYHGDYDTTFRKDVEKRHGDDTIWGPPDLPFITPVGPRPPVANARDENYEWGVGEDADIITVSPMFNPINSSWIIAKDVWGYSDADHKKLDLPRRTTIVTQSRISKRLLDIMHIENMRGNHVASEMTPQTVALLHGLKGVYAPHPVYMDRDWDGDFLNEWFNPGPNGVSGSYGSSMGWGRERRYQGTTWYYRAQPPNRLYNNWMGWPDTNIGGEDWEKKNGRPCLPSVMLHQVKDTTPTDPEHRTVFELAFG